MNRLQRGLAAMDAPQAQPSTFFLLLAQYEGRSFIPIEAVCNDFFFHLTVESFVRKTTAGDIDLPIIRIEDGNKAARGVHLNDRAAYLDRRRRSALKEFHAMRSQDPPL